MTRWKPPDADWRRFVNCGKFNEDESSVCGSFIIPLLRGVVDRRGLDRNAPRRMEDNDIWRLAARLIRMFDEGAEMAAAMYADRALAHGNRKAATKWNRITAAIHALDRRARPSRKAVN
jgi:hypothetical protein